MNAAIDVMSLVPAPVLASGLIRACGEMTRKNPLLAHRMLANLWLEVAPVLAPHIVKFPSGKQAAAIVFLESYFKHSGDWKAMEAELTAATATSMRVPSVLLGTIVDVICEQMLKAAETLQTPERLQGDQS